MSIINKAKVFVQLTEVPTLPNQPLQLQVEGADGKMINAGVFHNKDCIKLKPGTILGLSCNIEYNKSTNKKLQSNIQITNAEIVPGAVSISGQSDHPDFEHFSPDFEPVVLTEDNLNAYLEHLRENSQDRQVIVLFGTEASDDYDNGNLKSINIKENNEEYFFETKDARDAFIFGMNVAEGWDRRFEITEPDELAEIRAVLTKKTPKPR